jgi:DNA-binding IclR family transcriptional regulator
MSARRLIPRDSKKDNADSGVQVIARAGAILRALGQNPDGLTIRQISQLIDVPRSTVQRIVEALDNENLVISASARSGVRLGPALIGLAALTKQFDIAKIAHPVMTQLARELGETVSLAVLDGNKAVVVDQVPGIHALRAVSTVGNSLALHCSASGKAFLAMMSDEQLGKYRNRISFAPMTRHTICTWDELHRELQSIRHRGYALDREEHQDGICAVGTIIYGPADEMAAMTIPVPKERFAATEKTLIRVLLDLCKALQKRLRR